MKPVFSRITAFAVFEIYLFFLVPSLPLYAADLKPGGSDIAGREVLITPESGGELVWGKIRLSVSPGAVKKTVTVRVGDY